MSDPAPHQDPGAYTIARFCEAHGISEALYFKLRTQGRGPRELRIGRKVLITHESAAAWRQAESVPYSQPAA
jgi:hypothetical protein